jgi:hypothetical protein
VLAFSLTGGIGYAASAADNGTSALKQLVVQNDDGGKGKGQGSANKPNNNSGSTVTASKNNESGGNGNGDANQGGDNSADDQYGGKVVLCHVPPGNPGNAHTIMVGQAAVAAHLAHGDYLGPCQPPTENGKKCNSGGGNGQEIVNGKDCDPGKSDGKNNGGG